MVGLVVSSPACSDHKRVSFDIRNFYPTFKTVRNLGVILECDLSMTAHVNKLLGTCFYHIRQLRLVRRSLDEDAAHALVRALIHSRLDYCNGVLANSTMEKFGRLQSVLKAAARLIFKFPGRTSVTELIRSRLH